MSAPISPAVAAVPNSADITAHISNPAEMLDMVPQIFSAVSYWHVAAESYARAFSKAGDHANHAKFNRIASLIAEFRNGLATV